jgi:hypothetical protein
MKYRILSVCGLFEKDHRCLSFGVFSWYKNKTSRWQIGWMGTGVWAFKPKYALLAEAVFTDATFMICDSKLQRRRHFDHDFMLIWIK